METLTVLYDACVLYPAPLRDLLMHLAREDFFRARWTDTIHEEWIRSVLRDRPDLDRTRLERTRNEMNAAVLDCLVTGYEELIGALTLPDPDDRHLLAAAIRGRVHLIVTSNLRDFPADALAPYDIEAVHPDEFVVSLMELNATAVYRAVRRQRQMLKRPPKSAAELLETLENLGLTRTVARLRAVADLL